MHQMDRCSRSRFRHTFVSSSPRETTLRRLWPIATSVLRYSLFVFCTCDMESTGSLALVSPGMIPVLGIGRQLVSQPCSKPNSNEQTAAGPRLCIVVQPNLQLNASPKSVNRGWRHFQSQEGLGSKYVSAFCTIGRSSASGILAI